MGARKSDAAEAVRSRGFTPGRRDVDALVALLGGEDDDLVRATEKALVRGGSTLAPLLIARAREAQPPLRGRLCRVLGRVTEAPEALEYVLEAARDADDKTRRNAFIALGKVDAQDEARVHDAESALVEAWGSEVRADHLRSIAEALGKMGRDRARDALGVLPVDDPALIEVVERARLRLSRTVLREEPSAIAGDLAPAMPVAIVLRCREGLESILAREVSEIAGVVDPRVREPGVVDARLVSPLDVVLAARTWMQIAFPLTSRRVRGDDVGEAVTASLVSPEARGLMQRWTRGPVRYRLAFHQRGHARALVWRCAREIGVRAVELKNDPTASTWSVHVFEERGGVRIELEPRALVDSRFSYRVRDVPAASHPTIAAALARVAGAEPDDVVWDPFVGSGTELVERARLGPYAALYGTDLDPAALEAARANIDAAGIRRVRLHEADATVYVPPSVSLILTNPPMGRRVARGELAPLLDRFVDHVAHVLVRSRASGARLVWLSPLPDRTRERLVARGMVIGFAQEVDMGGFRAELQCATPR